MYDIYIWDNSKPGFVPAKNIYGKAMHFDNFAEACKACHELRRMGHDAKYIWREGPRKGPRRGW
jgi:hypothetical protein